MGIGGPVACTQKGDRKFIVWDQKTSMAVSVGQICCCFRGQHHVGQVPY